MDVSVMENLLISIEKGSPYLYDLVFTDNSMCPVLSNRHTRTEQLLLNDVGHRGRRDGKNSMTLVPYLLYEKLPVEPLTQQPTSTPSWASTTSRLPPAASDAPLSPKPVGNVTTSKVANTSNLTGTATAVAIPSCDLSVKDRNISAQEHFKAATIAPSPTVASRIPLSQQKSVVRPLGHTTAPADGTFPRKTQAPSTQTLTRIGTARFDREIDASDSNLGSKFEVQKSTSKAQPASRSPSSSSTPDTREKAPSLHATAVTKRLRDKHGELQGGRRKRQRESLEGFATEVPLPLVSKTPDDAGAARSLSNRLQELKDLAGTNKAYGKLQEIIAEICGWPIDPKHSSRANLTNSNREWLSDFYGRFKSNILKETSLARSVLEYRDLWLQFTLSELRGAVRASISERSPNMYTNE